MTLEEVNSRIGVVSFQLACVYLGAGLEKATKPGVLAGRHRPLVYARDMRRMVRRRERQMGLETEMRNLKAMRRELEKG